MSDSPIGKGPKGEKGETGPVGETGDDGPFVNSTDPGNKIVAGSDSKAYYDAPVFSGAASTGMVPPVLVATGKKLTDNGTFQ